MTGQGLRPRFGRTVFLPFCVLHSFYLFPFCFVVCGDGVCVWFCGHGSSNCQLGDRPGFSLRALRGFKENIREQEPISGRQEKNT